MKLKASPEEQAVRTAYKAKDNSAEEITSHTMNSLNEGEHRHTLKTLNLEEGFINYKVLRYIWLVNMPQKKENVLSVKKNMNPPTEEAKLVQKNVKRKRKDNMIKNISRNIQKFQELLQRIGRGITERKLIKEQENVGEEIKSYKLETRQIILSRNSEYPNMENVNYVKNNQIDKFIIPDIQRRISF